jgi:hypothetical protein
MRTASYGSVAAAAPPGGGGSGATSPTVSEAAYGGGYPGAAGWASPPRGHMSPQMYSSPLAPQPGITQQAQAAAHGHVLGGSGERPRRGSGSYYTAALAGTLGISLKYDDLTSLSPVVRKDVVVGSLVRMLRDSTSLWADLSVQMQAESGGGGPIPGGEEAVLKKLEEAVERAVEGASLSVQVGFLQDVGKAEAKVRGILNVPEMGGLGE